MKREDFIKKCSGCLTYENTRFRPESHQCPILYPINELSKTHKYELKYCPCQVCLIKSVCVHACEDHHDLIDKIDMYYEEIEKRGCKNG